MDRRLWLAALWMCACSTDSGSDATAGSTGMVSTTDPDGSGSDASSGGASTTGEADASSSTGDTTIPYDGEPIDVPEDGEWHFVEIDGMSCNGGGASGVGVRRVEGATRTVLYFKGGGACFNTLTCWKLNQQALQQSQNGNLPAEHATDAIR